MNLVAFDYDLFQFELRVLNSIRIYRYRFPISINRSTYSLGHSGPGV